MKNQSVVFWAIAGLFLTGAAACIVSGSVAGAIACALIGAAGIIAFFRIKKG